MQVPPDAVWATLASSGCYADWVVGSKRIRGADAEWPAPGTRFHHTIGVGPLTISDHTESLEADAPSLLRMRTKARPLGTATVTLQMMAQDGGTLVRMTETPDGVLRLLELNPAFHLLAKARNRESLARLERLALHRST